MLKKRKEENPTRWLHEEKGEGGKWSEKNPPPLLFSSRPKAASAAAYRSRAFQQLLLQELGFPPFATDGFIAGSCSRVLVNERPAEG